MKTTNNFNNGMQSDLSKLIPQKNNYLQALNFRAVGTLGESNTSLVNIKGNECKVSFPITQDLLKLKVVNLGGTTDQTISITVNGQTTPNFTVNANTTGFQIYQYLRALPNCYIPGVNVAPTATFAVAYADDYVVISCQPEYTGCGPTIPSVYPNTIVNRITTNPRWTLQFVSDTNTLHNTQIPNVLTHATLTIIGSAFIQEDIYLLVADYGGSVPGNDSFTGTSHIYKLNINDITKDTTLTLLYTNYLDFTDQHPVAPSAITGRYENDNVQRLYWSDFYNKIRTVNVFDPQLMALDPRQLSVVPITEYSQPVLNNIISGTLPVGVYQLVYRLKKNFGAVSNFSEPSNMVPLYVGSLDNTYQAGPSGNNTSKGIRFTIQGLDTSYDRAEFAIMYRDSQSAVATVKSLDINGTVIPSTGTLTIDVTSLTDLDDLELADVLLSNVGFTHAKTVETKDNRLFWGNVKTVQKELDNFDTRAFRAKTSSASSNDIRLTNQGVSTNYSLATAIALAETEDTINEYYDSVGQLSTNGCYFKPNTTGGILGGRGANISYEFGTYSVLADDKSLSSTSDTYQINHIAPYKHIDSVGTANSGSDIILNDVSTGISIPYRYNQQGSLNSQRMPYKQGLLKGYQHEETYRFGLQMFDLDANPLFTKWIADVKFPSYHDFNNNPDPRAASVGVNDFRLSYESDGRVWLQILYIKFDVNLASIANQINSYEIVRCERRAKDETILGVGLLTPLIGDGGVATSSDLYLPGNFKSQSGKTLLYNGSGGYVAGGGFVYTPNPPPIPPALATLVSPFRAFPSEEEVVTLNTYGNSNSDFLVTFDSYDFHYNQGYPYASGDTLLFRERIRSYNYNDSTQGYWWVSSSGRANNGNPVPNPGFFPFQPYSETAGVITNDSSYDNDVIPFFMMKFVSDTFTRPLPNAVNNYNNGNNMPLANSLFVDNGADVAIGGRTFHNWSKDMGVGSNRVSEGIDTQILQLNSPVILSDPAGSSGYDCPPVTLGDLYKMLALYFRPNPNQYGGNTYAQRSNNVYIACSELIPAKQNLSNVNSTIVNFKVFGGDVYTGLYDMQKASKDQGVPYAFFDYNGGTPGTLTRGNSNASFSNTFYIPCTNKQHAELRFGFHIDRDLNVNTYNQTDTFDNNSINFCENNIKTFFPKPLVFNVTDKWINRIYYSELKYNGETQDSWSKYLANSFYDVEGNYGEINCLIALKNQIYCIQERGFSKLLINPVSLIDAGNNTAGTEIKLGQGKTIERHDYLAIDVGTKHQWSVYNSQNSISFIDVRQKKIFIFNGESLEPISDTKGQRNFIIKRLHNSILLTDNPIINNGILTTFDYQNNEFLYTFRNNDDSSINDENLTLAFSEITDRFVSMYSFAPNIYINNHKYLLSNINTNKLNPSIYLHNYGAYGTFYDVLYKSTLKLIVNDNPLYTKVFDNLAWNSESIKDNIEWNDDFNLYPGSSTSPNYPDNVNNQSDTFNRLRIYNDWQNTDFVNLTLTPPNNNLRRVERDWNLQVPRNKFNYDTNLPSTSSLFDPTKLTKITFGERIRDKYIIIDLEYPNIINNRFIIHNLSTLYRISDR